MVLLSKGDKEIENIYRSANHNLMNYPLVISICDCLDIWIIFFSILKPVFWTVIRNQFMLSDLLKKKNEMKCRSSSLHFLSAVCMYIVFQFSNYFYQILLFFFNIEIETCYLSWSYVDFNHYLWFCFHHRFFLKKNLLRFI